MSAPIEVVHIGRCDYHEVLALQRSMRLARLSGTLGHDMLLLVEHDPVFTLGRGTHRASLPRSEDELRALGADVVEIERGGDVTWHGPGQLVGYPILDLTAHRQDLHWYLRGLEQVLIVALASLGVPAQQNPGLTGVWTRGRKIASIGVHVKQWVTMHGFALNVHPDLGWFDLIVPCGINGVEMTSIRRERDTVESEDGLWHHARDAVIEAFGQVFDRTPMMLLAGGEGTLYPSPHGRSG